MTQALSITIEGEDAAAAGSNDNSRAEEVPPAGSTPSGRLPGAESLGASEVGASAASLGATKICKPVDLVCAS